ncbi:MAG: GTP 3',8-cyclase MoaA [Lentisphaeraceae bacterium]|nr:GTP 3',8-cyclase MoaA [Lentisphaeraceae bacterium]
MAELLDSQSRPLRDLRISLTDVCNFRCTYCMPADYDYKFLSDKQRMNLEEIDRFVRLFTQLGVERVRLTGGEPLLRPDIVNIVAAISSYDLKDIALTTNGQLLAKHAAELKNAGLRRVTVSLDAVGPLVFKKMSGGRGSYRSVLEGIDEAISTGLTPLKVNSVVEKGMNEDQILPLADLAYEKGITVRYIEFMDVGNKNNWHKEDVISSKEILETISSKYDVEPKDPAFYGEVASHYNFKEKDGGIGLISSVTQPFCQSCTRGRLSAEGHLYTCLFATEGMDLLTPMRKGASDDELLELIGGLWQKREDRYSEERFDLKNQKRKKVEMFHIGG